MEAYRRIIILIFVISIFATILQIGFKKAPAKPLWVDELFTQVSSVEGKSWAAIWAGDTGQGSNGPIFYSIQKLICVALKYKTNDLWNNPSDPAALIILRISPIFCMSLGVSLIVWFFCVNYSLIGGLLALIISITSYMVWHYIAEARPYALIFLATAIQALILFYYYRFNKKPACKIVGAANVFLALVSPLSVIQIAACGSILWLKGCRKIWHLFLSIGLPIGITLYYYAVSQHASFYFLPYSRPLALILANIPSGRLWALFIFPALIWIWDYNFNKNNKQALYYFFIWAWVTLTGYVMFLAYLILIQDPPRGYEVCNRYLMPLTAIGIIAVTAGMLELARRPKSLWTKLIIWLVILMITMPRIPKAYYWIVNN